MYKLLSTVFCCWQQKSPTDDSLDTEQNLMLYIYIEDEQL